MKKNAKKVQSKIIRRFILENIRDNPTSITKKTVEYFGISRQAVLRHLNLLLDEKLITASGTTKNRKYKLSILVNLVEYFNLSKLEEDVVWDKLSRSLIKIIPKNVWDILTYGFTEMVNNAIDHSGGQVVLIAIEQTFINTKIIITDNGVGIFKKIRTEFGLEDDRHAILELAKGKLTTDPDNHSGEGIFFTSRLFDQFSIISKGLIYSHRENEDIDWIMDDADILDGTTILLNISNNIKRTLNKEFSKYTSDDDNLNFEKTIVAASLMTRTGDKLISRSQAKRLLARLNDFSTVILDFKDVDEIGQAFADQIFRVFQDKHPEVKLVPVNTSRKITEMINRVKSAYK